MLLPAFASSMANVRSPTTRPGVFDPAFDPIPSSPAKLMVLQHWADPLEASPHAYALPTPRLANVSPLPAGVGMAERNGGVGGPFPNWPNAVDPQQYAAPPLVNAQLVRKPVLTAVNPKAPLF